MIHTKIDRVTQRITEEVMEARLTLSEGHYEEAIEKIERCLDEINSEKDELEEVVLDVAAACRCLTVGRKYVYDDRFRVRENSLLRSRQEKAITGGNPVTAGGVSAIVASGR